MKYRTLGDSDLEVSEISLGSWLTYAGGVEQDHDRGLHPAGLRRGDQLLRHRERLRAGGGRGGLGRDPQRLQARGVHPRDQGLLPDGREGGGARAQQGADREAARRLAEAAADRLRRPLPVPPLRHRDPDRGDDGGADGGGRVREGALHRLQRVDPRADPGRARCGGCGEVRQLAAAVQHDLALPRGRGVRRLPAQRDQPDRLVAAGSGGADRQVRAGRGASRGLARDQRRDGMGDGALPGRPGAGGGAGAEAGRG